MDIESKAVELGHELYQNVATTIETLALEIKYASPARIKREVEQMRRDLALAEACRRYQNQRPRWQFPTT